MARPLGGLLFEHVQTDRDPLTSVAVPLELPLLHAVPLATWAALFKAHGVRREPKSLDDVRAGALGTSGPLGPALRTLRALARREARPAVLLAARVLDVNVSAWPTDTTAAALVAALLARAAKEPAIGDVLRAAELHLCRRGAVAAKRRYVGEGAGEPVTTRAALGKLAAAVEQENEARQARGKVEVTVARSDARGLVLDVLRPDPQESDLVRDAKGAVAIKSWTPLKVNRVTLDRL